MKKAAKRKLRYAVYSLFLCMCFLFTLEIGARVVLHFRGIEVGKLPDGVVVSEATWARSSLRLGWTGKPGWDGTLYGSHVSLNRQGFRSDELAERSDNTLRILFLGDSRTFGVVLERENTFPALAQVELSSLVGERKVEAFNAGIPGYSSYQGLRLAEKLLPELRPDVAVFAFGFNDLRRANLGADSSSIMAITGAMGWLNGTIGPLIKKSALLTLAFFREGTADSVRAWGEPRVSPEAYRANIESFVRMALDAKVIPIVLLLPQNPRLQREIEQADALLAKGDALSAFACYRDASDVVAAAWIRHYGAQRLRESGNERQAQKLLALPVIPLAALHGGLLVASDRPYLEASLFAGLDQRAMVLRIDEKLNDEELFIDLGHLNAEGCRRVAHRLTETIVERIKRQ
ncbi:MAG TPA: GDSL-type esterase/lipase family protein [bacterium]|nr:GDSL-type esterase/lipase family protein [bacterium]